MDKKTEKIIYYIANARIPTERAYGIQLAKMCEAFLGQGADLRLIVPDKEVFSGDTQKFYGLRHKIPTTRLKVWDFFGNTRFGFNFGALTFAAAYFFYLLVKKIKGELGIIYTIDLDQFSFFFIPFFRTPYFFETHAEKKKNLVCDLIFKRAKGIIAINDIIKKQLMETFSLPPEKILVQPNGADMGMASFMTSKEAARKRFGLPPEKNIVIYTGRFYGWKGLGIFFSAAEKLGRDFLICLIGGTKQELEKATGRKDFPPNLVCFPYQGYKDVPLWLSAADALAVVGTKRDDYSYWQTSPMKLFDYLVSHRPIIASRTPAIEQIVSENEVTFYEPDNAEDLAEKIKYSVSNEEALRLKTERAFEKARSFSWEKRAKNILEFMKEKL